MRNDFFKHILLSGGSRQNRTELETETLPYTFTSNSHKLRNYRIYGNTVNGQSVGNLVTEGEHAGEYLVPVTITNGTDTHTTNLYLPGQIKMVGDKVEYVDFKEQKHYKVRKNLFSTELEQGNVLNDGNLADSSTRLRTKDYMPCENGTYVVSFLPSNYKFGYRCYDENYNFLGSTGQWEANGQPFTITIPNTKYIKMNFAKENPNLDIVPSEITELQLEKGTESTDYEPYITNTELNVPLPALPTLSGTNTLSVGTTVQPSKIYLQGNIEEIETVSAEPVQTNVQSLQPLSLDNENAELDVMPSDKNEFQTNDISEMPVEDENSIEEILETENLETTGDDENAE